MAAITATSNSNAKSGTSGFRGRFLDVAPAMFLGSIDQTIVAAALPSIARSLNNFTDIAWIVTAYLLASTVAAPMYGRLGDAFGRRRALLWALAVFALGSLACALAPNMTFLIAARALQGLGGGGLMTLAQALIGEVVSPQERGKFQGWFGALFALASTLGPVAGGVLANYFGWRSIFWTNLPLVGIAALTAWKIPASKSAVPFKSDNVGVLLFIGSSVAALVALSIGGQNEPWKSWPVLLLVIGGLAGFLVLSFVEHRVEQPLLPPAVLGKTVIWTSDLCVLLFAAAFFGVVVEFPLFLQLVKGQSSQAAGWMLLPLTIGEVAVSTWTGLRISASGRPRPFVIYGLLVAGIGFLSLGMCLDKSAVLILLSTLLIGMGLGPTMPAAQTMVQWGGGSSALGEATASVSFARSFGGVLGTAVASSVLIGALTLKDPSAVKTIMQTMKSVGVGVNNNSLPIAPLLTSFRFVFFAFGIVSFIAAGVGLLIPNVDLSSKPSEG